jgi:hypothetical protein
MKIKFVIALFMTVTTLSAQIGKKVQTINSPKLAGLWQNNEFAYTMTLLLNNDGTGEFEGEAIIYKSDGKNLKIIEKETTNIYQYVLQNNKLTLSGGDLEKALTFTRYSDPSSSNTSTNNNVQYQQQSSQTTMQNNNNQQSQGSLKGIIASELAGKWCYINVSSSSNASISSSECITIYANGTYEYYSESSGSASGTNQYGDQTFSGGTASQSSDRGMWRLDGNTLNVQSQSSGFKTYTFQKMNHPKNKDPMIVIDGRTFVTYYQKQPW